MIQKATDAYLAKLFIRVEEDGFYHRHHQGHEPAIPQAVALGLSVAPIANAGRWLVVCPHCGGAQLAAPEFPRFFCVDCTNVAVDGAWLAVDWPTPTEVAAI